MTATALFRPSTKKVRGIASKTKELRDATLTTFEETGKPVTVRQMFYMLSVRGVVEKEESGYRKTARHLLEMRRANRNSLWFHYGAEGGDSNPHRFPHPTQYLVSINFHGSISIN